MNRLIPIAVVVLGSTLAVSGAVRWIQARLVFEGSVVDESNGQPVVGAEVTIAEGTSAPPDFVRFQNTQAPPSISKPGGILIVTQSGVAGDMLITTTRTNATGEKETTTEQVLPNGERRQVNPDDLPRPAARFLRTVKTDSRGKFVFDDIVPGTYTLAASADGYLYQVYGQKMEFGAPKPLNLVAGGNNALVVRLSPTSTVSGAVTNPEREPVVGIPVCLLQPAYDANGERRFRVVSETQTAKDGHYALTGIAAGRYYLASGGAGPLRPASSQSAPHYALTYYPNVSTPDLAAFIDVLSGSPMSLGDLVVSRQIYRTVRGHILDSVTGKPPRTVTLSLIGRQPFDRAGQWSESSQTADYDALSGNFEFRNVPAGQYRVDAALPRTATARQFPADILSLIRSVPQDAYAMVNVSDNDVDNVMLLIHEPARLQAKVVVAGGRSLADIFHGPVNDLQFSLEATLPLQPSVSSSNVAANGAFEIHGLFAGRYRFDIFPLPENVYVSEVRLNGMRVADGILDIPADSAGDLVLTLNPAGGEIQGTAADDKSQPLARAEGLLLPDPLPEATGFYSPVYTDTDGRFTLHGIAPGNYRIYIWDGIGELQYFDRDLLTRSRQQATAVHIENGSRLTVTVRSIRP